MVNLPPLLARKWGHLPYLRQTSPTEWHSACPVCGETDHRPGSGLPDRFHMHTGGKSGRPRGKCRKCGYFAFADVDDDEISQEEVDEWRKVAEETAEEQQRKRERKLETLQEDRWYERFTDMTEEQQQAWRDEGIPDAIQAYMRLGYTESKGYHLNRELLYSPAMVIPYFEVGWEPVNVQFRLMDPAEGAGKYRFTSGLASPLYLTDPDSKLGEVVLVCEGAKKALVTYIELVLRCNIRGYSVVGAPSKQLSAAQAERLDDARRIYLLLDPDAGVSASGDSDLARMADALGRKRVFTITLPYKVDDLINAKYLNGKQLEWMINHARKA